MSIPAILNNLLDYDGLQRRIDNNEHENTSYIWVKKGKVEEAWAVCALLGLIVDDDVQINGRPAKRTYIFAPLAGKSDSSLFALGVGGRYNLRDLHAYFKETDNEA